MEEKPFGISEFEMNFELYKRFFKFAIAKTKYRLILSIITYIIIGYGLIMAVIAGAIFGFSPTFITIIIFMVALLSLKLYQELMLPRILYKKSKKIYESVYSVKLFNQHLQIETKGNLNSGQSNTNYEALYKAYEINDMFFLNITPQQAYIIPKETISVDAGLMLRDILKEKLGKNFKVLTKK